jgi:cell division protein FtsA
VARKERYLVGLDVGTSKVTAVVSEIVGDALDCRRDRSGGIARHPPRRRSESRRAVESIKKAIEEAELMAGVEVDSVHLALSGPAHQGFNSRGVIAGRRQEPRDHARGRPAGDRRREGRLLPTGREILHVLPQDFVVDEQDGIGAPVGMTGARLEVNVHIITGSQSSTQNIVACVNRPA